MPFHLKTAEIIPCEPDADNAAEGIVFHPTSPHRQDSFIRPSFFKKIQNMQKLQFITHFTAQYSYLDSARMALEGGCKWIQLRMKNATTEEWLQIGTEVGKLCQTYGATFIIDDHTELVKELHADGVHLGKQDMPIDEARKILGPSYIIGGTANTYEDIVMHARRGADYIGCGPFRFTTTKEKLSPILGLEGYRQIISQMNENGLSLPVIAIGGITAEDIPAIMNTGVSGIAISGTILRAEEPTAEMQRLLTLV